MVDPKDREREPQLETPTELPLKPPIGALETDRRDDAGRDTVGEAGTILPADDDGDLATYLEQSFAADRNNNPDRQISSHAIASPGWAGRRLGRYRVIKRLGHGAFGVVLHARDEELRRDVAIKVPTPSALGDGSIRQTVLSEARTAASLDHPHLVPILDFVEGDVVDPSSDRSTPPPILIVMPFVGGGTLADRLRRNQNDNAAGRAMPPRDVAELGRQLAIGLSAAHESGLVHRDLKPANVLIDEGRYRIADFGLAVSTDGMGEHELAGTPAYMSPEQIHGPAEYGLKKLDGRSDLWALGVILYEAATGKRPFEADDRRRLFDQISNGNFTPVRKANRSVPAELASVIERLLTVKPDDRFINAYQVADELTPMTKPETARRCWHCCPCVAIGSVLLFFAVTGGILLFVMLPSHMANKTSVTSMRLQAIEHYFVFNMAAALGPMLLTWGLARCRRIAADASRTSIGPQVGQCRVSRYAIAAMGTGAATGGIGPPAFIATVVFALIALFQIRRRRNWITGTGLASFAIFLSAVLMSVWTLWWTNYAQFEDAMRQLNRIDLVWNSPSPTRGPSADLDAAFARLDDVAGEYPVGWGNGIDRIEAYRLAADYFSGDVEGVRQNIMAFKAANALSINPTGSPYGRATTSSNAPLVPPNDPSKMPPLNYDMQTDAILTAIEAELQRIDGIANADAANRYRQLRSQMNDRNLDRPAKWVDRLAGYDD